MDSLGLMEKLGRLKEVQKKIRNPAYCRRVIVLSEAATGKEICRFEGFASQDSRGLQHKIISLAFSPDDQFLASGDSSGGITLWQLRKERSQSLTIKKIRTFIGSISHDPIQTLGFSPDGRTSVL